MSRFPDDRKFVSIRKKGKIEETLKQNNLFNLRMIHIIPDHVRGPADSRMSTSICFSVMVNIEHEFAFNVSLGGKCC